MSLSVSSVPRALEAKSRMLGFELDDLLVVFLYLAVSNMFFGRTALKVPIVWGGTVTIAAVLHFAKRGKPERHLQDLVQHYLRPGVLSSAVPDTEYVPLVKKEPL